MLPSEQASEINRQRGEAYGHPLPNFETTAAIWSAWLGGKLAQPLTAEDVAVMMILLKAARLRQTIDHADSILDICGYANTLAMVTEARKPPAEPLPDRIDLGGATPGEIAKAIRRDALVEEAIDRARVAFETAHAEASASTIIDRRCPTTSGDRKARVEQAQAKNRSVPRQHVSGNALPLVVDVREVSLPAGIPRELIGYHPDLCEYGYFDSARVWVGLARAQ